MKHPSKIFVALTIAGLIVISFLLISLKSIQHSWKEHATPIDSSDIITIKNDHGATLSYSSGSGIKILKVDGFSFKDLNKNGKLDKYEDWRMAVEERPKDLASKMSIEQIAGLM